MGQRTWDVHLHKPGRREIDPGDFIGPYRDVGDGIDDEPEVGSIIYVGMTRYQVVHYATDEDPTGGKLIVERAR